MVHEITRERTTWLERRRAREEALGRTEQPYCLVVGGGQGGIGLAARLQRLGIPTIVVDKHEKAGDAWRNRYKSLHLHDPVWYDHMPYLPFPDDWPVFPAKDKVADWLMHYADIMELNYWARTECRSAEWDEQSGTWTVVVDRDGEEITQGATLAKIDTGTDVPFTIENYPYRDPYGREAVTFLVQATGLIPEEGRVRIRSVRGTSLKTEVNLRKLTLEERRARLAQDATLRRTRQLGRTRRRCPRCARPATTRASPPA